MYDCTPTSTDSHEVCTIDTGELVFTPDLLKAEHELRVRGRLITNPELLARLQDIDQIIRTAEECTNCDHLRGTMDLLHFKDNITVLMDHLSKSQPEVPLLLLWNLRSATIAIQREVDNSATRKTKGVYIPKQGPLTMLEKEEQAETVAFAQRLRKLQKNASDALFECLKVMAVEVPAEAILGSVQVFVLSLATEDGAGNPTRSSIHELTFSKATPHVEPNLTYERPKTLWGYGKVINGPKYRYVPDDNSSESHRRPSDVARRLRYNFRVAQGWKDSAIQQLQDRLGQTELFAGGSEAECKSYSRSDPSYQKTLLALSDEAIAALSRGLSEAIFVMKAVPSIPEDQWADLQAGSAWTSATPNSSLPCAT